MRDQKEQPNIFCMPGESGCTPNLRHDFEEELPSFRDGEAGGVSGHLAGKRHLGYWQYSHFSFIY